MSNLSNRVEKAKRLQFNPIPAVRGGFGTWGSKNDHYQVVLSHETQTICTPDSEKKGDMKMLVFLADCQKTEVSIQQGKKWAWVWQDGERVYKEIPAMVPSQQCTCKGNERHTVCYHSLGAIYHSFKNAEKPKLISFYEEYEQAVQGKNFGGEIAKIQSINGNGFLWCVIRDWPNLQERIELIRGNEAENEGID